MITRRAIMGWSLAPLVRAGSLPEQSAAIVLERAFPDPGVSYLLLDAPSGRLVCSRWAHPEEPVPVGSLVKPFTALAYGETHSFRFPDFTCLGERSQCWLPQGHGRMEIVTAIAHSCNAYFLRLAWDLLPASLETVARRLGMNPPQAGRDSEALICLATTCQVSPLPIPHPYLGLP